MMVFWQYRLVILAVPKTGTTALENAIGRRASINMREPPVLKHSPVFQYMQHFEPIFRVVGQRNMKTLAIVRHPVDWLGSWYRYRHRDDLVGKPNSTRGVSFDDFVSEYVKPEPAGFANVGSQARFLKGEDVPIGVDFLYRYEAWDKLHDFLQRRLRFEFEMPTLNVSPRMELSLSPQVRALLEREKPEDFAAWEAGLG